MLCVVGIFGEDGARVALAGMGDPAGLDPVLVVEPLPAVLGSNEVVIVGLPLVVDPRLEILPFLSSLDVL